MKTCYRCGGLKATEHGEAIAGTLCSCSLGPATCWTAPSEIPPDVARKILAARDALIRDDSREAWHQLYSIADPAFESFTPWAILEAQSNIPDDTRGQ